MIDWRTHAFSLVAVFLALGIGIAIGVMMSSQAQTVVVQQEQLIASLHSSLALDEAELRQTRLNVEAEQQAAARAAASAAALWPEVVQGTLEGRRVAFVNVGDPSLEGVALTAVRAAGGQRGFVLTLDSALVSGDPSMTAAIVPRGASDPTLQAMVGRWAQALLPIGTPPGSEQASEAAPGSGAAIASLGTLGDDGTAAPTVLARAQQVGAVSYLPAEDAATETAADAATETAEDTATETADAATDATGPLDGAAAAAVPTGVRPSGVHIVPQDSATVGSGAATPNALVILLPADLDARQWTTFVQPWLDAARAAGIPAVAAAAGQGEGVSSSAWRAAARTVDTLGEPEGAVALVRALAGPAGHYGNAADDDALWPPRPVGMGNTGPTGAAPHGVGGANP